MYAPRIVKDNLQLQHCSSRNAPWLLKSAEFCNIADSAASCILNISEHNDAFLLKRDRNRYIFRIKTDFTSTGITSVVVKSFPLKGLKNHLYRYRRYGPAEASNLLKARSRTIPVPLVYGYGHIRRPGVIDSTIVVMEDLNQHSNIGRLLSDYVKNNDSCLEILRRAGKLLVRLYEGCCNHIDINSNSIMLGRTCKNDRVIDFQYASFHDCPSLNVLAFNIACCSSSVSAYVSEEQLETWAAETFEDVSAGDIDKWVATYKHFMSNRLSRKQRLSIR